MERKIEQVLDMIKKKITGIGIFILIYKITKSIVALYNVFSIVICLFLQTKKYYFFLSLAENCSFYLYKSYYRFTRILAILKYTCLTYKKNIGHGCLEPKSCRGSAGCSLNSLSLEPTKSHNMLQLSFVHPLLVDLCSMVHSMPSALGNHQFTQSSNLGLFIVERVGHGKKYVIVECSLHLIKHVIKIQRIQTKIKEKMNMSLSYLINF